MYTNNLQNSFAPPFYTFYTFKYIIITIFIRLCLDKNNFSHKLHINYVLFEIIQTIHYIINEKRVYDLVAPLVNASMLAFTHYAFIIS